MAAVALSCAQVGGTTIARGGLPWGDRVRARGESTGAEVMLDERIAAELRMAWSDRPGCYFEDAGTVPSR